MSRSNHGGHYTFVEYRPSLQPVQRPHPPLLIAAGGPRMLPLAAREADIIGLLPSMSTSGGGFAEDEMSLDAFATKVAVIREIAGERFASIDLNILVQTVAVTADRPTAIRRIRKERELTDDACSARRWSMPALSRRSPGGCGPSATGSASPTSSSSSP